MDANRCEPGLIDIAHIFKRIYITSHEVHLRNIKACLQCERSSFSIKQKNKNTHLKEN